MKKQSYEMNPASLKVNDTWNSLDISERGIFREILDHIWLSDKHYRMPYDPASMSENLEVTQDNLECIIAKLVTGDYPLLVEEFDLSETGFFLSSPLLRDQVKNHERWVREERHRTMLKNKDREKSLSLVSRINQKISTKEPHVAYLKPEQRDTTSYFGWLPTDRFNSQGQVYYIRESFLSMLKESYPDEDVESQILRMHAWLVKKPYGRKRLAMMNRFIINWLENQAEFRDQGSDSATEVDNSGFKSISRAR
jgi:hypothetical protein